jgi:hypothetical protein
VDWDTPVSRTPTLGQNLKKDFATLMFPIVSWNLREGNLRASDKMIPQYFGMLENSVNYLVMHLMR